MRFLLVEDHQRLASLVQQGMREVAEMDLDIAGSVQEAHQALACHKYDAVVLDLGLPDRDGLEFLKEVRNNRNSIPILILTSRISVADRVRGLDAGADDYLVKPFAMEELAARLRAILRRPATNLGTVLTYANIAFDAAVPEARVDNNLLHLSPRECRLLEQLLRRAGKVVPKTSMEQSLYGVNDELSSNTVEVLVHRLRKRLADAQAQAQIHTVRGVGYMILPDEA